MKKNDNDHNANLTEQGRLVVSLSKSLFAGDIDAAFREFKIHMIENELTVTDKVIAEFDTAGLIQSSDIEPTR